MRKQQNQVLKISSKGLSFYSNVFPHRHNSTFYVCSHRAKCKNLEIDSWIVGNKMLMTKMNFIEKIEAIETKKDEMKM